VSVLVSVSIGSGNAYRAMEINLLSTPTLDAKGRRDLDQVGEYEAFLIRSLDSTLRNERATFQHRYGDDVFVLIAKAAEAHRALSAKRSI
jgi:hypothetical protein